MKNSRQMPSARDALFKRLIELFRRCLGCGGGSEAWTGNISPSNPPSTPGMLAPPRPAPQKLTKPAGRNGAKLTIDFTDYAHTFGLRVVK